MAKNNYFLGELDNIEFVVIFTKYQDKWVYCWHKRRESFEHPGGHVEQGESSLQAAKRELYEETGITDCKIIPLWDYEQLWDDGIGKNNGRVYVAIANSLGKLPESEMGKIELFDTVPDNYTYDKNEEVQDINRIEKMLKAYKMEYLNPAYEDTSVELIKYSSGYQKEYMKIYNDGYHNMREALDLKPYDFIQDDSFFEEGMDNVFLFMKNNEIAGTVALKGDEIDDLIVNKKYQGKGYGKQILFWAIKNIRTERPVLHVAGWNEKAIELYKSVGFEITETMEIL